MINQVKQNTSFTKVFYSHPQKKSTTKKFLCFNIAILFRF